jgi:class 3 adenylate cyclase/tetratricopeptide (TPR) repeat protein
MITCPNCSTQNADAARFCMSCGTPLDAPRPVEGERKFATVLFADVVRSTALAEQLDPEDWAAIMNGAFGFMNAAITRYGGTVARLMGDAVLAFFGAPVAHEDDAERAVLAGLEIRDGAASYARSIQDSYGVDFSVRVGINTGISVLAFVGDAVKAEYTAMGDTANVAARMQSAARPGTVYISEDTYRLVRGAFDVQPRGPVEARGKQEPVETWEVLAALMLPGKRRGLEGMRSPLVGRGAELALLRQRLAALGEGRGGLVALVGEAGIGKSRLLAELRDAAGGDDGAVAWYEGRGISYGQALAYHPWQQLGRQLIGADPADPPVRVRERLREACARLGIADELIPVIEALLAVATDEGGLGESDGDALLARIAAAVGVFLDAAIGARNTPHVLVFDDLHWSDASSVGLLERIAPLIATRPLLIVAVLRPERSAAAWPALERLAHVLGGGSTRIELTPLGPADARELLGHLLHIEDLPAETRTLMLRRAEGNPFFLEEVIRSLVDAGFVVRENGHWRATRAIDQVQIPETLLGVLGARIDRLPAPTKRVVQTAAVLGRTFTYRPLSGVCRDVPPPDRIEDVHPHLDVLAWEELVQERARVPEPEYRFKHALTQEAAYGLLLKKRRRELHARAGAVLESLYPERLEELAPVLALHFREGGAREKAAAYSLRAGRRALSLFALQEALEHFDRVYWDLATLPEPPAEMLFDAILSWSQVRQKLDDFTGVIDRLAKAEELARKLNDRLRLAQALSWTASVYMLTGFPSRGVPALIEAQELATELGDEQLGMLPFFFATEAMVDRDPAAALPQLERVIEMTRKYRVPEIEGHALAAKALALARIGRFDDAEENIRDAFAAATRSGSAVKQADVHIMAGFAYYAMGDPDRGLEYARKGAELAHSVNALECACAGFFTAGLGNLERRELDEALQQFDKSLQLAGYEGWESFVNRIHGGVASAEFEQGQVEAVARLEGLLRNARAEQDEYTVALFSEWLGEAHLRLDEPERADGYLEEALAYYRQRGMQPFVARVLDTIAALRERQGRSDEARDARRAAGALRATFRREPAADAGVMVEA